MRLPRTRVGLIAGYPVSRGCGLAAGGYLATPAIPAEAGKPKRQPWEPGPTGRFSHAACRIQPSGILLIPDNDESFLQWELRIVVGVSYLSSQ